MKTFLFILFLSCQVFADNLDYSTMNKFYEGLQNLLVTGSHIIVDSAPVTPVTGTFWQATQPVSGTFWQATQPVSGTFWQATQPVSISTMPSTPVTGTFWQATQPVSIATMPSTPVTGTFWQATQPVSGTITADIGGSGALALDASVVDLQVLQSSTTAGQSGTLTMGAVTTSAPSYTTAKTNPLSLTTGGLLRVDASGSTVPVSGTFWQATQPISAVSLPLPTGASTSANQSTANASLASIDTKLTNPLPVSATSLPLPTGAATSANQDTGNTSLSNIDTHIPGTRSANTTFPTSGAQQHFTMDVTGLGSVTFQITGTWTGNIFWDASLDDTNWAAISASNLSVLDGQVPVSTTLNGAFSVNVAGFKTFRISASAISSGTAVVYLNGSANSSVINQVLAYTFVKSDSAFTVQPGNTANTTPWLVKPNDGTRSITIKAASTAALATDTSQVVALSPNSPIPSGTNVIGHVVVDTAPSTAVTNTGTFAVQAAQSGTWNVGTVTTLTGITDALPAGTNVIGHVINDTGSTTAVTGNVAVTHAAGSISGSNPCINPTATLLSINGATSGTAKVQLIALSGSTKIYICSMNITGVSGTSPTFSLVYGTGTACATGTTTIVGAWTTAASTIYNFTGPTVAITGAGTALCYLDGGTSPVQNYNIVYVQQ